MISFADFGSNDTRYILSNVVSNPFQHFKGNLHEKALLFKWRNVVVFPLLVHKLQVNKYIRENI
jgi:hypothetical protein